MWSSWHFCLAGYGRTEAHDGAVHKARTSTLSRIRRITSSAKSQTGFLSRPEGWSTLRVVAGSGWRLTEAFPCCVSGRRVSSDEGLEPVF